MQKKETHEIPGGMTEGGENIQAKRLQYTMHDRVFRWQMHTLISFLEIN